MREILFRGFCPDEDGKEKVFVNGEWIKGFWVYGYYVLVNIKKHRIYTGEYFGEYNLDYYVVIPETVGQYTGLKDKNGKNIFYGDIIKHYNGCSVEEYSVDIGRVFFYPQTMRYLRTSTLFPDDCPAIYENNKYEVIGNIFENPELLEEI